MKASHYHKLKAIIKAYFKSIVIMNGYHDDFCWIFNKV
jgi:hypothetical protein